MKLKSVLLAVLVILIASSSMAQIAQNRKIPDFTLTDIEGRNFNLYKNLGPGPVYVSFWATWCKPCVEELKIIEKLYEKYKDQGFEVVAINTEGPKASAKVKSFVKTYGFTFTVLNDNDGEVFRRKFKGAAMPYTVMADQQGNVIMSSVGFKPGDEVEIEKKIVGNLVIPPDTTGAATIETAPPAEVVPPQPVDTTPVIPPDTTRKPMPDTIPGNDTIKTQPDTTGQAVPDTAGQTETE